MHAALMVGDDLLMASDAQAGEFSGVSGMYVNYSTDDTAEGKRVFFIASASWCGPCRLLSRFLSAHKEELGRHYVFVKLDISRDKNGDSLRNKFQGARDGGVPLPL